MISKQRLYIFIFVFFSCAKTVAGDLFFTSPSSPPIFTDHLSLFAGEESDDPDGSTYVSLTQHLSSCSPPHSPSASMSKEYQEPSLKRHHHARSHHNATFEQAHPIHAYLPPVNHLQDGLLLSHPPTSVVIPIVPMQDHTTARIAALELLVKNLSDDIRKNNERIQMLEANLSSCLAYLNQLTPRTHAASSIPQYSPLPDSAPIAAGYIKKFNSMHEICCALYPTVNTIIHEPLHEAQKSLSEFISKLPDDGALPKQPLISRTMIFMINRYCYECSKVLNDRSQIIEAQNFLKFAQDLFQNIQPTDLQELKLDSFLLFSLEEKYKDIAHFLANAHEKINRHIQEEAAPIQVQQTQRYPA